jgi:hypothetical protein
MFSKTMSVPQAVMEILSSNNLYLQALQSGIANYTALAQRIKPEIERLTTSNVNTGTIVVAIKRLVDSLHKEEKTESNSTPNHDQSVIIEGVRMSLTGSIMDVDFNESEFDQLSHLLDEIFDKRSNFSYNLFQSDKQIRLLAEDVEEFRNLVSIASKKFDGRIKERLSKITITIPPHSDRNMDPDAYRNFISLVSDIIYNSRIKLEDAFFTPHEIVLVLEDKDAAKAYELISTRITKR